MIGNSTTGAVTSGFPRLFRIAGYRINAYKFFLCVGIYVGALTAAAFAASSGLSPLPLGLAATVCALAGLIGARLYHMLVHAPSYWKERSLRVMWDSSDGGSSLFGSLLTFIPAAVAMAAWLTIPAPVLFDHLAVGVLAGGFWVRLGCVFNGCCGGRTTDAWLGVRLHDTCGISKPRVPVQFMEMAWWLIGLAVFFLIWPDTLPAGSYALAVGAWYGAARFFLEPLRERPDMVCGRVPIDQVMAAVIAVAAGGTLIIRAWAV